MKSELEPSFFAKCKYWISGFALLIFISFSSCADSDQKIVTELLPSGAPTNQLWNMTTTLTDSGLVKSIIKAGYTAKFGRAEESKTHMDSSVYVQMFDEEGNLTSTLTCGRGIIDDITKDMEAFDRVKLVTQDGTILESEYLKFLQTTGKISSDRFVTITKPTQILRGTGFESDRNVINFKIFKASGEAAVESK
ncbi:MAG: LPS export ABC transporter periplasmic protein LptC [Bacteroidetes bacterium]|nr:LPS export ABC transporter periplasmic protein LptC [Bacteroidota bacterium]